MRYFINNVIALLTHVLLAAISILLFTFGPFISDTSIWHIIIAVVCPLGYAVCGVFLKPVEKLSFLSVAFVSVVLALALIFSIFSSDVPHAEFIYFYMNPLAFSVGILTSSSLPALYLSPVFPYLLMYLGIILRKYLKYNVKAGR